MLTIISIKPTPFKTNIDYYRGKTKSIYEKEPMFRDFARNIPLSQVNIKTSKYETMQIKHLILKKKKSSNQDPKYKKKPSQSISATDAKLFIPTETSPWQTGNLVMSTIIDHDHIVKLSIRRVEEMGSGAAYCQLMDLLYPGEGNVAIIISHDMISK